MKGALLLLCLLFPVLKLISQVPSIEWQNTIGGSGYEFLFSGDKTYDGGYIFGGMSTSEINFAAGFAH